MNESKILSKAVNYANYLSLFFMIISGILSLTVKNKICIGISWSCFALCVLTGILIEIKLNCSKLDIPEKHKNIFYYSTWSEVCCWLFITVRFLYTLFINSSFVVKVFYDIIIVLSSFISLFLSDILEDTHHKYLKILICISYSLSVVIFCITKL